MLRPFLAIGLILTMLVAACAAPTPEPTRGPTATPTPTLTPAYDHAYTQGYQSATREGLGTHGQRHAYAKAYAEARESGLDAAAAAIAAQSSAAAVTESRIYPTPTPFPTLSPEQRRTRSVFLASNCRGSAGCKTITRAAYGAGWPLTVNSATLHCEELHRLPGVTKHAVWVEVRGEKYGVNGTARGWLGETRWKLHDIWRDDPNFPGNKVSVDPLIQDGLALLLAMPKRGQGIQWSPRPEIIT